MVKITNDKIEEMKENRDIIVHENEWDNVNQIMVHEVRFMNMKSFIRVHDIMDFFGTNFEYTAALGWDGVPVRISGWE